MYKVSITNILNNRQYGAKFDTEQEALDWIAENEDKESWGRNSRVVTVDDEYDQSLIISQEFGVDEYGEPTSAITLKAEYEVTGPTLIDGTGNTEDDKQLRLSKAREQGELYKKHMDHCRLVQEYFTALINARGATSADKDSLQSNPEILSIMNQLQFGRVSKAKVLVDAITTDETLIYAEDIAKISQLMQDFLDSL